VKPIDSNLPGVVDYAFNSIKNGKVDLDDILILPKADGELRRFEGRNIVTDSNGFGRVVDEKSDPTLPEKSRHNTRQRPGKGRESTPRIILMWWLC
jgi:hypothetical protein